MALLGCIGFLSMSSQRMCITVALICMLNQTAMSPPAPDTGGGAGGGVAALTIQPSPAPPGVTADAGLVPLNESLARDNNLTTGGRRRSVERPASACGELPEIFVLNTSDFSRFNVSPALTIYVRCTTIKMSTVKSCLCLLMVTHLRATKRRHLPCVITQPSPSQVNASHLRHNARQRGRYSNYLSRRDVRLS